MKNHLTVYKHLFLSLVLAACGLAAFAQAPPAPRAKAVWRGPFHIKTNIVFPVSMYGESGFAPRMSVQGGFSYDLLFVELTKDILSDENERRSSVWEFAVPVEARYYLLPGDEPMTGMFAGPFVKYSQFDIIYEGLNYRNEMEQEHYWGTRVGIGTVLGLQGRLGRNFLYEVSGGLGVRVTGHYNSRTVTPRGEYIDDWHPNLVSTRFGLLLGYRVNR